MIIALCGRKSVGKNTIANILSESFSTYKPIQLSFAYNLKKVCHDLYEWAGVQSPEKYEQVPGMKAVMLPKLGMPVRDLWIKTGIFFRSVNENTWVEPVVDKAKMQNLAILTDCRFPNEVEILKKAGAILVQITRPQIKNTDDAADCALDGFDNYDIKFVNKSVTLKGLEKDVKKFLVPTIGKHKK